MPSRRFSVVGNSAMFRPARADHAPSEGRDGAFYQFTEFLFMSLHKSARDHQILPWDNNEPVVSTSEGVVIAVGWSIRGIISLGRWICGALGHCRSRQSVTAS